MQPSNSEQAQASFAVEPDRCVLRLSGGLGVADAEKLRVRALEWSAVTQIDADIGQVLAALRAAIAERKQSLRAVATPHPVQTWLETAGLSHILVETVEAA